MPLLDPQMSEWSGIFQMRFQKSGSDRINLRFCMKLRQVLGVITQSSVSCEQLHPIDTSKIYSVKDVHNAPKRLLDFFLGWMGGGVNTSWIFSTQITISPRLGHHAWSNFVRYTIGIFLGWKTELSFSNSCIRNLFCYTHRKSAHFVTAKNVSVPCYRWVAILSRRFCLRPELKPVQQWRQLRPQQHNGGKEKLFPV